LVATNVTLSEIQNQILVDGFAVVMVPFAPYSMVDTTGLPTDIVNTNAVSQLKSLVDSIKASGINHNFFISYLI
jgi:hypothetical protein